MIPPEQHHALRETLAATGRAVLLMLGGVLLLLVYGAFQFNGLKHREAMDQAQVGRNLARGEGFTTYFIRPLSLWTTASRKTGGAEPLLRHPDLINPPLYPALAASLFYILQKGNLQPPSGDSTEEARPAPGVVGRIVARVIGWRHGSKLWWLAAGAWLLWLVLRAARFGVPPSHVPWHATGVVVCALLGGLFWAAPTSFAVGPAGAFTVFGPDRWVAYGLGIPLTLLNCALLYGMGRRLFDRRVAFTAVCLFGLAETTFQFALSGLSTMLTMAWVNAAWLALLIASEWRETGARPRGAVALALAAAAAMAGACLTHYAAGWLLLPLCAAAWRLWGLARGARMAAAMSGVFVALTGPWLARNVLLSGNFFGLAGYALAEHTRVTPGDTLQRVLEFKPLSVATSLVWSKALGNAVALWNNSPWMASYGVVLALFVAALLYRFRRALANRFKWLVAASWLLLGGVWCFTGVGARPENTVAEADNLLVLLVPLMTVLSTAVFYAHLDGLKLQSKLARFAAVAALVLAAAMPLALRLAGPAAGRMAYPPYHPPLVSHIAGYVEPAEFFASDQPWAVAWYGDRRCFWIPYSTAEFLTLHDMHQHIAGLLLTPVTLNSRLLTDIMAGEWAPWSAVLGFLKFPKMFPLQNGRLFIGRDNRPMDWRLGSPVNLDQLTAGVHMVVLCDSVRWKSQSPEAPLSQPPAAPTGAKAP